MVQVYDEPTVLVAKRVTGEEEVPEGAVAVLTPDAPDVLSHVSVRARNMKVLFAICHEEGTLKEVEDKEGTTISLQVLRTSCFAVQVWVLLTSFNNRICTCTLIFCDPRLGAQDVIQQLAFAYAAYGCVLMTMPCFPELCNASRLVAESTLHWYPRSQPFHDDKDYVANWNVSLYAQTLLCHSMLLQGLP